jgi:hypothetical protein
MPETSEYLTKDHLKIALDRLENKIDRLENKIDAKFNAVDAKFNSQRLLLLSIVLGVVAQIVNAWIIHLK